MTKNTVVYTSVSFGPFVYRVGSNGEVFKRSGRLMKATVTKDGYLRLHLGGRGRFRKDVLVHRLVAEAFVPPLTTGLQINHLDGNKLNNRVENLEWVTPRENIIHAFQLGLQKPRRGESNGNAKLCKKDVALIRRLYEQGTTQTKLAGLFRVKQPHISRIIRGEQWV